ncbi:MAG: glycogen/starch synthase [Deltaproteobacteria bacterium]|nr:glycogen/starch synthase [Deltaproteobacteria bacterium]
MNIVLITHEMDPFVGRGTVAQVAGALPKALRSLDHEVSVILPLFEGIDPAKHSLARRLSKLTFEVGGKEYACEQWNGRTISGVEAIFIGHEELFHSVPALDAGSDDEVALRAGVFARAVAALLEKNEPGWEVVHAHGWLGAASLAAASEAGVGLPAVLTVHDPRADGPSMEDGIVPGVGSEGVLAAGARRAEVIAVGSPNVAKTLAESLGDNIGNREIRAIANGVDEATWNPLTDPELPARFDPVDLRGKARCKAELQRRLEVPVRADAPVVTVLGREPEAWRRFVKTAPRILRNDVQVIALGAPDVDGLRDGLADLQDRWPDRFQARSLDGKEGGKLDHLARAGADLALVLTDHAPDAIDPMIVQRYGAVPIVPRVGAIADTVVDCDANLETGTGFLFEAKDEEELLGGVRRAIGAFGREGFGDLQSRVMRIDSSWERSARLHGMLYEGLVES